MFTRIAPLLSAEFVNEIAAGLDRLAWEDGMDTAGPLQTRKNNEQLTVSTVEARPLLQQVAQAVLQHPEVRAFAEPKKMARIFFGKYGEGMHYGRHNDAPITAGGGQGQGRADVSFTVFLADPESYQGGELILESAFGEIALKEPVGHAVFYDSGLLHRVEKVRSGTRLVAVGWIESWIGDPQERAILRELHEAIRDAAVREAEGAEAIRLRRIRADLVRRWAK
jgi:PKHD-type hydroxylase